MKREMSPRITNVKYSETVSLITLLILNCMFKVNCMVTFKKGKNFVMWRQWLTTRSKLVVYFHCTGQSPTPQTRFTEVNAKHHLRWQKTPVVTTFTFLPSVLVITVETCFKHDLFASSFSARLIFWTQQPAVRSSNLCSGALRWKQTKWRRKQKKDDVSLLVNFFHSFFKLRNGKLGLWWEMLDLEVVPERSLGNEQWEFVLGAWLSLKI